MGWSGEETMANANRQVISRRLISAGAVGWIAAGILIALGAALQLGELGYGPYQPANRWLFSLLATGGWHMLTLLDGTVQQYVFQFWPLLLVLFGCAILSLANNRNRADENVAASSRMGEDHDG